MNNTDELKDNQGLIRQRIPMAILHGRRLEPFLSQHNCGKVGDTVHDSMANDGTARMEGAAPLLTVNLNEIPFGGFKESRLPDGNALGSMNDIQHREFGIGSTFHLCIR